jgi:putative transposase
MLYDPGRHHRRSIRLRDYDYSQAGAYFVTICTHDRQCVFGDIVDGQMQLNACGQQVEAVWHALPERFPGVELDEYVMMPNHVHGIISLGGKGAMNRAPTLGEVVRAFKALTARSVRLSGLLGFAWQRNYHEHIIRNEEDLDRIREYVAFNPADWSEDSENPGA